MHLFYQGLLIAHVLCGAASLALFWMPVVVKKGSPIHIRTGKWYANCMYLVAVSAFILSIILITNPIGLKHSGENLSVERAHQLAQTYREFSLFLLAIAVLVISNIRHGLLTLKDGLKRTSIRAWNHNALNLALAALGLLLVYTGYQSSEVLFYIFAFLCLVTSGGNLNYAWRAEIDRSARIRAHLGSMIGAGIASHTAFFVFGANRFFGELFTGNMKLIPWVLPGVVGSIIIFVLSRRYSSKRTSKRSTTHA